MKDYIETGDNIFADLGLPNPEERLAKAKLAMQIDHIIRKKDSHKKKLQKF